MNKLPLYEQQKQGLPKADDYQTPPYALDPLLPYLPKNWAIWECAAGNGNLVFEFVRNGYGVIGTDINSLNKWVYNDFLKKDLDQPYDCIVTNPPYSKKNRFIERCYELGKPWAMLMNLPSLGTIGRKMMYKKHGIQLLLLKNRVNYETPHGGNTGAWFESLWFTWGLNLPNDIVFT